MIKPTFCTERFVIRDAAVADIAPLSSICKSWKDKELLEGYLFEDNYIEKCITQGDLPPADGACQDLYALKVVERKQDSTPIGFFDLYHGYPQATTLWISIFVIDAPEQEAGVGKEIITQLTAEAKAAGLSKIGVGVYLKNWKGLRFWFNNGLSRVTAIKGDKEFGEGKFAVIHLEKSIQ